MSEILNDFIKEAFRAGKNKVEIHTVLKEAGWEDEQLGDAWKQYYDSPFPVPVPRPSLYASPRLVVLNLFHFLVLYITIYSAVVIIFTILDYQLPDGLGNEAGMFYSSTPIGEEVRGYLSALLVCLPLVFLSHRLLHKAMVKAGQFIPSIRLRLLNIMLLFATVTMLSNFISFVYYFLSGELGLRFIIKVVILSGICAGLYAYFKPEMQANEARA